MAGWSGIDVWCDATEAAEEKSRKVWLTHGFLQSKTLSLDFSKKQQKKKERKKKNSKPTGCCDATPRESREARSTGGAALVVLHWWVVTAPATDRANLNNLLSSLSSKTQMVNGFYNFSAGENSDKVNAIALCRADQPSTECGICVNISAHELLQLCPNQKEGIIWYANCTVRYSDRFIFGRNGISTYASSYQHYFYLRIGYCTTTPLRSFFNSLRKEASGLFGKFANATFKVQNSFNIQDLTVYALMQCTPDLAERDCDDCLLQAQDYITTCCNETVGARVLTPSCNLRYEKSRFFYGNDEPPPSLSPSPLPPPPSTKGTRFPTHIF
uniref:Gnk2-homologous domain-containing protein n=1 Tax=Fagus sylvatica TaxID=28930 RepID=A0A2N9IQ90_FAGSY